MIAFNNQNTSTTINNEINSTQNGGYSIKRVARKSQIRNLQELFLQLQGGEEELNQLIRSVTFFCKGEDKMLQTKYCHKIRECLTYHFAAKDSFLFHHEQKSDYFYVILKGKCSVLIPKKQSEIKQEDTYLKEIQGFKSMVKSHLNESDEYTANIYQQKVNSHHKRLEELRSEYLLSLIKQSSKPIQEIYLSQTNKEISKYKVIITLSTGDYFGESAFSTLPKRNGSIWINEDSHFARLKREDFLRIFENEIINSSVSKQYLTKIFSHLQNKKLDFLNSYVEERQMVKNQIIFSQNQKNDGFVYFVSSGVFEVQFNLCQPHSVIKNVEDNLIQEQLFKYNKSSQFRLLSLIEGEIFGIEDYNKETKSFSVICSSAKGSVFRFRQAILTQLEDVECIRKIKNLGLLRSNRIQEKIEQQTQQKNQDIAQKLQTQINLLSEQSTRQKNYLRRSLERSQTQVFPQQCSTKNIQSIDAPSNNMSEDFLNYPPLSINKDISLKSNLNHHHHQSGDLQQNRSLVMYNNTIDDSETIAEISKNLQQPLSKFDYSLRIKGFKRQSIRRDDSCNQTFNQSQIIERGNSNNISTTQESNTNYLNTLIKQNSSKKIILARQPAQLRQSASPKKRNHPIVVGSEKNILSNQKFKEEVQTSAVFMKLLSKTAEQVAPFPKGQIEENHQIFTNKSISLNYQNGIFYDEFANKKYEIKDTLSKQYLSPLRKSPPKMVQVQIQSPNIAIMNDNIENNNSNNNNSNMIQSLSPQSPKSLNKKYLVEQLKVKPLHKNHFSIFSQEQFNDMCVKSDLRPSLNPLMIKKRIKQDLQSKSIYRSLKTPAFLRSSSTKHSVVLNKTVLSPERDQIYSQKKQRSKVRSVSSSMSQRKQEDVYNVNSISEPNESVIINVPKGCRQMQNYQFQKIDQSRKSKMQSYDFPSLLQSQVKFNYFNSNIYSSYIPSNVYPVGFQNYSPTKILRSNQTNHLHHTTFNPSSTLSNTFFLENFYNN